LLIWDFCGCSLSIFGLYYLISSVLAIALAMVSNFIWNDIWTWRGMGEPGVRAFFIRLLKFCLVASLAGYIGNLGVFVDFNTLFSYTLHDFKYFRNRCGNVFKLFFK